MTTEPLNLSATPAWHTPGGIPRFTPRAAALALPTLVDVEAFARRAGFTAGYDNLESWARRMAERAAMELAVSAFTTSSWRTVATPPAEGVLVVVGWLDPEDAEHPERHDFDVIEDGIWQKHAEDREHFLIVAPPGSTGPKETAPYTHWMPLAPIPKLLKEAL